jgi:hypothetical protein
MMGRNMQFIRQNLTPVLTSRYSNQKDRKKNNSEA